MASINVISSITLSVTRPNSGVIVYAKQFDKIARLIDIHLVSGSSDWDPPEGSEIVVMCSKPDGTKCIYDVADNEELYSAEKTYNVGDLVRRPLSIFSCIQAIETPEVWNPAHWQYVRNVTPAITKQSASNYRLALSEQATAAAGNVFVEICFFYNGKRATTLSFILCVEPGVPDNDTLKSTNYFNVLTQMIEGLIGATANPPVINDGSYAYATYGNWMQWSTVSGRYEDSGMSGLGEQGEQGEQGIQGNSIDHIQQTGGTGYPGTYDTYSVILDNEESAGTFRVYNGQDGNGSPGSAMPVKDGTGSAGSANAFSRQDHVHPANVDDVDPEGVGDTASPGTSNVYARRDHVHAIGSAIFDAIYPIGSIYMSMSPVSPSTLFGGDWIALKDRFLLGAGSSYQIRDYGGEVDHRLTIDEIPKHRHSTYRVAFKNNDTSGTTVYSTVGSTFTDAQEVQSGTAYAGADVTNPRHNNMPPYLAVYMGERVEIGEYDGVEGTILVLGVCYEETVEQTIEGDVVLVTHIYQCTTGSGDTPVTGALSSHVGTYLTEVTRW